MAFIECRQVVKAYSVSGHEIVALRGIDFEMERGEMVAIIGPSGAGKSSLLNLLGGLDTPTAGQYELNGVQVSERGHLERRSVTRALPRPLWSTGQGCPRMGQGPELGALIAARRERRPPGLRSGCPASHRH